MVSTLIEPIIAGVLVSLFNRYVLNTNSIIYTMCEPAIIQTFETEDCSASENTTSSDISLEPHIHIHN